MDVNPLVVEWVNEHRDVAQLTLRKACGPQVHKRDWVLKSLTDGLKVQGGHSFSTMELDLVESDVAAKTLGLPLWDNARPLCVLKRTPFLYSVER